MLQMLREQVEAQFAADARTRQRWIGFIGLTVAVGLAYFLAARLSLHLLTKSGVAVFWPAAGISSGILIALGRDARWPVAVGTIAATIAANLLGDRNIWSSSYFALCDAGEALFVAWMIQRYFGSHFDLGRLSRVLGFLASAIVGTVASGIAGTVGYKLFHSTNESIWSTWQHWFASDVVGIITVAPLIIGFVSARRVPPPRRELTEGAAALLAIVVTTGMIILKLPPTWWDIDVLVVVLLPLLVWVAARCQPVFAAAAVFTTCLMIVLSLTFDFGHYGRLFPSTDELIANAHAGIVGVTLCGLILASLFAERRRHEAELEAREDRMRAIVNTVVDAIITIDDKGIVENFNPAAGRIFGYSPEEVVGRNIKMLMPEPYRREHDGYLANYLATGQAKIIGLGREVAGQRKDGSTFPIELAVSEMTVTGRRMFTGVVRDITERKRADERQKLLVAELDHRVKNVLVRVAAIATETRESSHSMDDFVKTLGGRFHSMAAAHALLSKGRWQGVGIADLIRDQLAPYATGVNATIQGPNIILAAATTQALAMVVHELATNAVKFGALSAPGGRVSVGWGAPSGGDDAADLTVEWRETGGPPVAKPTRSGFGTSLIEELIAHELGGMVDLAFDPAGVCCRMKLPLGRV